MLKQQIACAENKTTLIGLASYLYRDGLLNYSTAQHAQYAATQAKMSFTQYLVATNLLSSEKIFSYCLKIFKLPAFYFNKPLIDLSQLEGINFDAIAHHRILPLFRDQKYLYIGMTDPTDYAAINAINAIQFHTQLRARMMLISENGLSHHLQSHIQPEVLQTQVAFALSKIPAENESTQTAQQEEENDDEPVIVFVDQLFQDAIKNNVSDIHIEPYADHIRVRFRRDGLLYEATTIPTHLGLRVSTRLKVMANLNIAEKRLPQDGRFSIPHLQNLDIRLSTCPTLFGEKIVLRIFPNKESPLEITQLGMNAEQLTNFLNCLQQPQGLILVTGPTGSGKTITLYSALHYLNLVEKNICTAEDPIEMELNGINQLHINQRIGLDFVTALRHFLRQDPDVIMVGEIRDIETANVAIHAAQTGHLVLATLHTNNALDTITRLQALGVPFHDLASTISLVIAQRLVRKLCHDCKQVSAHDPTIFTAIGCSSCHKGYQGRTGIFEVLSANEKVIMHVIQNQQNNVIQKIPLMNVYLRDAGLEKVQLGITTHEEILRVLG